MKTIKYFYILLTSLLITQACNKKLDVLPQQSITPDQIKTAADVKAVLYGGYKLLQNASAFGEQMIFMPDLLASEDQVDFVGTFTNYKEIQLKTQDKTSSIATGIWSNAYTIINITNTVLNKIDLIDADEKNAITGEAEYIRGITYFELVNLFGQPFSDGNATSNLGVPLVLEPVFNYDAAKDNPSRATVDDVYKQVIADLSDAAAKLPEFADDSRATRFAAQAFLARVYMNMGDYTNAATMANEVIASGDFALTQTFDQAFNNATNSSEDIFVILQTSQSNAGTSNSGLTTFYSPTPAGRGDAQVDPKYPTYFAAGDFRRTFAYAGVSIGGFHGNYTGKWSDFYTAIPVVRLAEMYLTRGEANLRKGGTPIGIATPLEDINRVRKRAGASALGTVSGDDFVDERFRELGFEGDRLWTLKRLKMDVDGFAYNYEKLIFPVPQREMDVNKNLVQNPGY